MRSFFQAVSLIGAIVVGTGLSFSGSALADSSKPSVESFFHDPAFNDAQLSPSGRYAAILISSGGARVKLGVVDLSDMSFKVINGFADADIADFHWVNDNRLVFSVTDKETAQADVHLYPGLFGVDRDGSNLKMLVEREPSGHLSTGTLIASHALPGYTQYLGNVESEDGDDIFVIQAVWNVLDEFQAEAIIRLNTRTGQAKNFDRPGNSVSWVVDNTDTPRVTLTRDKGQEAVFYKDPETNAWRKIAEFKSRSPKAISPYGFTSDGSFYVEAKNGKDTTSLYRYDLTKNAMASEPLINTPGYDFQGDIEYDSKHMLGVHFTTDAGSAYWFDEKARKIQKDVDALLPKTVNQLSFAFRPQTQNVLVYAYSDVEPGMYLIYDAASGKLSLLGKRQPNVDPKKMSQRDMVRYKARDGLDIPAYLTMPIGAGKKNLPLVMLVHGGPYVRGGVWDWDAEAEFLASRGYVVLQPEFRGSTGFGSHHFVAGWKQWGLGMQNDIADGAKWAISQGIADPKRICIVGASYGGYATLMGLINDPDLYRCGIDYAGVTDINLMYDVSWSDASDEWQRYGMPTLVGDQVKDAAQLKATSPLENAARIKQPLLLAYGGADRRVPIVHGVEFRDAVQKTNPNVDWVVYAEEGHGWYLLKNRIDFYTRVEKFLQQNIGTPPAQTASSQ